MRVLALSVCALGFLAFAVPAVHAESSGNMPMKGQKMMQKIDTNGDGKISKDEYMAMSAERFKKMDTNHDGFLSADEHKAAHEQMKNKMQERKQNMMQRKNMSAE